MTRGLNKYNVYITAFALAVLVKGTAPVVSVSWIRRWLGVSRKLGLGRDTASLAVP